VPETSRAPTSWKPALADVVDTANCACWSGGTTPYPGTEMASRSIDAVAGSSKTNANGPLWPGADRHTALKSGETGEPSRALPRGQLRTSAPLANESRLAPGEGEGCAARAEPEGAGAADSRGVLGSAASGCVGAGSASATVADGAGEVCAVDASRGLHP